MVVADGIHSATRELVLGPGRVGTVDTGWGSWVEWCDTDDEPDLGEELWGADFFVGSYPVRDRIGVFLGGARKDTAAGPARFVSHIRGQLRTCGDRFDRVLDTVARNEDPYYWPLADCRGGLTVGAETG